jgi:hypothetical protein
MHRLEYTRFAISLFVLLAPVPSMLSLVGWANPLIIRQPATVAAAAANWHSCL